MQVWIKNGKQESPQYMTDFLIKCYLKGDFYRHFLGICYNILILRKRFQIGDYDMIQAEHLSKPIQSLIRKSV